MKYNHLKTTPFYRRCRIWMSVAMALCVLVGLGQISSAIASFDPNTHYRIGSKAQGGKTFVMQGNYGKGDGANSWPEDPNDGNYDIKGYEWKLIRVQGAYYIINHTTGMALAQSDINQWDVGVAKPGTQGTEWTLKKEEGEYYRIVNKASTLSLFQGGWGREWDVHTWADGSANVPTPDAYLWKIQKADLWRPDLVDVKTLFKPNTHYRIGSKAQGGGSLTFLMQGNYGKENGANSWPEEINDGDYNTEGYEWQFINVPGAELGNYYLINHVTGKALAQSNRNEWGVGVADRGTTGTEWVIEERSDGYFRILNKNSTLGLFQADWGNDWDVHVWADGSDQTPMPDAYLWRIQEVIPPPAIVKQMPLQSYNYYRIGSKTHGNGYGSFLMQGNYGKGDGANSWPEDPNDGNYDIRGYEWYFIHDPGAGQNVYYIVNHATGKVLAQSDRNAWGVSVADKGTIGTRWTMEEMQGGYFRIKNRNSGLGLFQASWGDDWDVHVWADGSDYTPTPDAYLWRIQKVNAIPTVTIDSVKCIKASTGIDGATKVLFMAVDMAIEAGLAAATGGGSIGLQRPKMLLLSRR